MRRKRFEYTPNNSSFALNITSMTDMFTVLLVFLLQNYSASTIEVKLDNGVSLPISNTEKNPTESIQVNLSKSILKLGEKELTQLDNGRFNEKDLDKNDSNFIQPLFSALEEINKQNEELMKDPKNAEKVKSQEGKILIMADSSLSYQELRKVMYTASMAGFPQVKLATLVGN